MITRAQTKRALESNASASASAPAPTEEKKAASTQDHLPHSAPKRAPKLKKKVKREEEKKEDAADQDQAMTSEDKIRKKWTPAFEKEVRNVFVSGMFARNDIGPIVIRLRQILGRPDLFEDLLQPQGPMPSDDSNHSNYATNLVLGRLLERYASKGPNGQKLKTQKDLLNVLIALYEETCALQLLRVQLAKMLDLMMPGGDWVKPWLTMYRPSDVLVDSIDYRPLWNTPLEFPGWKDILERATLKYSRHAAEWKILEPTKNIEELTIKASAKIREITDKWRVEMKEQAKKSGIVLAQHEF